MEITSSFPSTAFKYRAQVFGLVLSVTCGGLLGCGGSDKDPLYTVQGSVSVKGTPVKQGVILFVPSQGRSATGLISGGEYSLTTYTNGDGAREGTYKVQIEAMDYLGEAPNPEDAPTSYADELTKPLDSTANRRSRIKWVVPEKYSDASTTPLEATVEAKELNEINFDIP